MWYDNVGKEDNIVNVTEKQLGTISIGSLAIFSVLAISVEIGYQRYQVWINLLAIILFVLFFSFLCSFMLLIFKKMLTLVDSYSSNMSVNEHPIDSMSLADPFYCSICKNEIEINDNYCPKCGNAL